MSFAKAFGSSFSEIDEMELELLLDLFNVYLKINGDGHKDKKVFIDDIL